MTDNGRRRPNLNLAMWSVIAIAGLLAVVAGMAASAELGIAPGGLVLAMALIPVAASIVVGLLVRAQDAGTYLHSDRKLASLWSGMGGAAGALPASFLFGLAGILYLLGFDGLAYVLGWLAGMVIAAVAIGPHLAASGARTVPDFFQLRCGAGPRVAAAFVLVLVSFLLLVAECSIAGSVIARLLSVERWLAVLAVVAAVALATSPGGMQAVTRFQVPLYIVLAVGFIAVLGGFTLWQRGVALPQLSYGDALAEISRLETAIIEKGLADLRSFQPHTKPFLQIDRLNFFALTLTVMAGAAALPHVVGRFLTVRGAGEARLTGAWMALFIMLLLITAPAYAAFAKLEFYSMIAQETPLGSLPAWIEPFSRADLVHIHGTSMKMLEDVAGAVRGGAADTAAVTAYLKAQAVAAVSSWLDLKPQARAAMIEAAQALGDAPPPAHWHAYQATVLPAAALAAGNKTGFLTHGGFVVEPSAVALAVAGMTGAPLLFIGIQAAAFAAAMMATASALTATLAGALGHDIYFRIFDRSASEARLGLLRASLLFAAGVAAVFAAAAPPDAMAAIMLALCLAGATLFPALVLGIWWPRMTSWGVLAGMGVGLAVVLYYSLGTRYIPVVFYEAWPQLSNASDAAIRKFASLKAAWAGAAEGDAKAAAWTALEAHARGSGVKVGPANWFGVHGSASALFALPAALFAAVVVSALTQGSRSSTRP